MNQTQKRAARGRPPAVNPKKRHNVMLRKEIANFIRSISAGNLSAGIELLAKFWKEQKGA